MIDLKKELSIIVYSCYRNRDMWSAFSYFFKRYDIDNTCKIVLVTDKYDKNDNYIFNDVVEVDSSWADMIKLAIKQADTPYVMLFMDDYLISDYIDKLFLETVVSDMKSYKAQNIRLKKSPFSRKSDFVLNENYYQVMLGSAYCFSTQVGVWDSSFLMDYLSDGMSAWEFERVGSMKCRDSDILILEHKFREYPYVEAVRKGKWMRCGVKHCEENGYDISCFVRKKTTMIEELEMQIKKIRLRMFPDVFQTIQNMVMYQK